MITIATTLSQVWIATYFRDNINDGHSKTSWKYFNSTPKLGGHCDKIKNVVNGVIKKWWNYTNYEI